MSFLGFPDSSVGKEATRNAGDPGSIPGLGRSPREGIGLPTALFLGFPCGSASKESTCNVGDLGSIPRLGRSLGEGKSYPLQYSGLENSMDCIVRGVTKTRPRLNDFHHSPLDFHQDHSAWSFYHFCPISLAVLNEGLRGDYFASPTPTRRHFAVSGEIFVCYNWKGYLWLPKFRSQRYCLHLISQGCHNKLPQTEICCLTILEARNPNSRGCQGQAPSECSREEFYLAFDVSQQSLAFLAL